MTIAELIRVLEQFPQDAPVCTEHEMRGPQTPRAFYWTEYGLDGKATDYGYPAENTVVIR